MLSNQVFMSVAINCDPLSVTNTCGIPSRLNSLRNTCIVKAVVGVLVRNTSGHLEYESMITRA